MSEKAFYPVTELRLFTRYNRDTYIKEFGRQALPWDQSRRIKRWADPDGGYADDLDKLLSYTYFDGATRTFKTFQITAAVAASINLPGEFAYPEYVIPPTPATLGGQSINPEFLCYEQAAEKLAAELAGTAIESNSFADGPYQIDWHGETRRVWHVKLGANLFNAGLLLKRRHRDGLNAPGHWDFAAYSQPVWTSERDDAGEMDPRPEVPLPSRQLYPNEALHLTPTATIVYRTDLESEFNTGGDGTGCAFRPDLVSVLQRTDANVQTLLQRSMTGG